MEIIDIKDSISQFSLEPKLTDLTPILQELMEEFSYLDSKMEVRYFLNEFIMVVGDGKNVAIAPVIPSGQYDGRWVFDICPLYFQGKTLIQSENNLGRFIVLQKNLPITEAADLFNQSLSANTSEVWKVIYLIRVS